MMSAMHRNRWPIYVVAIVNFLLIAPSMSRSEETQEELKERIRSEVESDLNTLDLKVKALEAELALAKSKLANRRSKFETIVASRIRESLENKDMSPEPTETSSESAAAIGATAWNLWQQRKLDEALPKFKKAVVLDPKNANLWNGLGWTQTNMGVLTESVESFKKALAINPKHLAARNGLGQSYLGQGKLDLAEQELLRATQDFIDESGEKGAVEAASWYGLVHAYLQKKDKEKAIEWAERLLKHKPEDATMKQLLERAKGLSDSKP